MTRLNKDIYELIHDIHVKLGSIDGKLTVLIALNVAMVLAAIGPYLAVVVQTFALAGPTAAW